MASPLFTTSQNALAVPLVYGASFLMAALLVRTSKFCKTVIAIEHASRLEALDGLRGVLCLGVLLHHAAMHLQGTWTPGWNPPEALAYEYLGKGAVAIFFCLTGYLFWGRIRKSGGVLKVIDFFRGRVLRVVPMYLFSALLCVGILAFDPVFRSASATQMAKLAAQIATIGILPWSMITTPLGVVFPSERNATVIWSLRYEWVFYFALPVLALLIRTRLALAIYGIALAAAIYFLTSVSTPKFLMFAVGMLAADAQRNERIARTLRGVAGSVLVIVAFVALLAFGIYFRTATRGDIFFSGGACLLTLGVFTPIACGNSVFGLFSLASLRFVGVCSYSVYLLHGTVLYLARDVLLRQVSGAGSSNLAFWTGVAGCGAIVVLASAVTYRFVELPFINLAHAWRTHRKPAPVVTAVAPVA